MKEGATNAWLRRVGDSDGELVLELGGELDIATAPRVQESLDDALSCGPRKVVFEVRNVTFIDSSGLAVLLSARRQVDAVELRYASASLRRVIELAGLGGTLPVVS